MHILVTGLSHKTAPIDLREKMTFPASSQAEALNALSSAPHISEAVILSTCNRTEVYAVVNDTEAGKTETVSFLSEFCRLPADKIEPHLYFHTREHSIHHLLRVVCSLDSMVLGEAQILGQVKEAYQEALEAGSTSVILNKLFTHALKVGKRARTETGIGESAVSVSSVAVELAQNVFEDLKGRTVMIIGAGEMSQLTGQALRDGGVTSFMVANRTYAKAEQFAREFKAEPVRFEDFPKYMVRSDIVISSTGAPTSILDKGTMQRVMAGRRRAPIFLIDIAVPRDIDPDVGDLHNVFLYNVDDLQNVVAGNIADREAEARKVEELILEELNDFTGWLSSLEAVPTIAALTRRAEEIRNAEVEKALSKLDHLSDRDRNEINALAKIILSKMLHEPVVRLKRRSEEKDQYLYVEILRDLFDLDRDDS